MFGSTGPGANKSVEILGPVYLYSVLLLSGPAVSVCVCSCIWFMRTQMCIMTWVLQRKHGHTDVLINQTA